MRFKAKKKYKEVIYKPIMGFDIETADDNKALVVACFYAKDRQYTFTRKEEVIQFLNSRQARAYTFFATNLAFDFLGLLYEDSQRWKVIERNGIIYGFTYYQQTYNNLCKKPLKFYDTTHLIQGSVEQLGKLLSIPKLAHPKALGKYPKNKQEEEELYTYCLRDAEISCKIIEDILYPYLKKHKVPLKYTIGSTALEIIKRNFLKDTVLFQEPEEIQTFTREGYYGGLTMNFKRGLFPHVAQYDINSLYPYAMTKQIPDPSSYKVYEKGNLYNITNHMGVSRVKVYVPEDMYIPILPKKIENKLICPVGVFEGTYNHNELVCALKYGVKIIEIHKQIVYRKELSLCKEFIKTMYKERLAYKKQHSSLEKMSKLIMNSSYGKFAFNYKQCSQIITAKELDYDKHIAGKNPIPLADNQFFSVTVDHKRPNYVFPIIASYITSHARITMQQYLQNKALQPYLIYMDTDSIHLSYDAGLIKTSDKLGDMKLEYRANNRIYVKPKMYQSLDKDKCKGIQIKDINTFKDIIQQKPIKQLRFTKFRTAIRSLQHHTYGILLPNQLIQIQKKIDLEDTKRLWSEPFSSEYIQDSTPLIVKES